MDRLATVHALRDKADYPLALKTLDESCSSRRTPSANALRADLLESLGQSAEAKSSAVSVDNVLLTVRA